MLIFTDFMLFLPWVISHLTNIRRGSIPLWVIPSAYTILYFLLPGLYPWLAPPPSTVTQGNYNTKMRRVSLFFFNIDGTPNLIRNFGFKCFFRNYIFSNFLMSVLITVFPLFKTCKPPKILIKKKVAT